MQKLYGSSSVTLLKFSQTFTLLFKAGLVPNKLEASAGTPALKKNMKTALGSYISVSLVLLSSQFVQIRINNRIQKHLDTYDTLEESPHRFFKAGHAHEYMSVSEEANVFLVKLISLTKNIWLYKKTWSDNRKKTMG